tara:strand:- start:43 stop:471 length:429 start_codon:yes stop_codon:yes gene_type:complete
MNNSQPSINIIIENIIEEFEYFDDWEERYAYLIDLGRKVLPIQEKYKTDSNKLKGCQSIVYFHYEINKDKRLNLIASSDAAIVQGLIGLLLRVYDNRLPGEILNTPTDFLRKIGLEDHLSITRKNGLSSMISAIKSAAQKNQ